MGTSEDLVKKHLPLCICPLTPVARALPDSSGTQTEQNDRCTGDANGRADRVPPVGPCPSTIHNQTNEAMMYTPPYAA